jgi:aminoglycoside phosphotransferase family enzyme/predicted kinase
MPETLPPIIKALLEPGCYPNPVQRVELIETHASWVLLAGEFAYKIKKPITLPFLDYGTLDKRRACCEAELQLNRRFAPDIYLDVVAIFGTPENPRFGSEGPPIEFAVKMRRFDEAGRLDRVCFRGELKPAHISSLAEEIIAFHRDASIASVRTHFGLPSDILAKALENFNELNSLLPDLECPSKLDNLLAWTRTEFNRLAPHFTARREAGLVRECHGDLHLGNLVLIKGRVILFDCIEFNEDFRWIDVASEIAFTYIDLLDHRQPGLANYFLNEWLSQSGDYDAMSAFRFYAVYRALVRAKVAAIRASQDLSDHGKILEYITLAERLALPPTPRLIITYGLSGSGKTTASTSLILDNASAPTILLRSDLERKRLFGLAAEAKSQSPVNGGIYDQNAHLRTYHRMYSLAQDLLNLRWSVIVDAAFLMRVERVTFHSLATHAGAEFNILAPQSSPAQLRERIVTRMKKGCDASEATLEVLEQQIKLIEPLDTNESNYLLIV